MKKQLCLLCLGGLFTLSGCNWFEKKETKSTESIESKSYSEQSTDDMQPSDEVISEETSVYEDTTENTK